MRLAGVVILLLGAGAVAAPYAIWWWTPERRLDVAVLDNTVPDATYREHRGLFWVLNQQKYRSSTHGAYRAERDYYGFFPRPRHRYAIRPLPAPLDADLIYLA